LWVRALDSLSWQQLQGTGGAFDPFWSPDSGDIGFFTLDKVMRVPATGGDVQTICNIPFALGGTWNNDGVIMFHSQAGFHRVAASGGTPVLLQSVRRAEDDLGLYATFLPDNRHYVFVYVGGDATGIYLGSLDSSERTQLKPLARYDLGVIGFASPNYILFVEGGVCSRSASSCHSEN
jgi:hypothetical protein